MIVVSTDSQTTKAYIKSKMTEVWAEREMEKLEKVIKDELNYRLSLRRDNETLSNAAPSLQKVSEYVFNWSPENAPVPLGLHLSVAEFIDGCINLHVARGEHKHEGSERTKQLVVAAEVAYGHRAEALPKDVSRQVIWDWVAWALEWIPPNETT